MAQKTIEEMKADFVMAVFETINKQIQQTDIKTSLIISMDSIIAIVLGREVGQIIGGRGLNPAVIVFASLCMLFLSVSIYFIYWTLRPRTRISTRDDFTGLLYTGDILRLAKKPSDRIAAYMKELESLTDPSMVYGQFVNSIVLISDVSRRKNRSFQSGLLFTAISFGFLVLLMATVSGIDAYRLKESLQQMGTAPIQ